jgi:nitroreductase
MDLREILKRRRMVRAYEPEPISRETIERIVGTVRRAPSAGFSQGQRLVVVTDAGTRQRIAEIVEEASPVPRSAATLEQWLNAPVLIVVNDRRDLYPEILERAGLRLEERLRRHVNRRTGRRAGEFFEDVLVARL